MTNSEKHATARVMDILEDLMLSDEYYEVQPASLARLDPLIRAAYMTLIEAIQQTKDAEFIALIRQRATEKTRHAKQKEGG